MAGKRWKARKAFSIHEVAYAPGDALDMKDLQRVPGDWKKLERAGWIEEKEDDDGS